MNPARRIVLLLALMSWLIGAIAFAESKPSGGTNSPEQANKPYLVLVSIDGFRWDFADRYGASAINGIGERGLVAEALQPVFPTLTFPNHFSIATGVLPTRHGIVANEFPHEDGENWYFYKNRPVVQDGSWYLAEPIWVTAEKQGMVSAAYFFVGTEADVNGIRPTHWRAFTEEDSGEKRVNQVLDWLNDPPSTRPHVITLYFEDVDNNTHWYGPGSTQSIESIRRVDAHVKHLLDGIAELPHGDQVYVLLVSDHGQATYDFSRPPLVLDRIVGLEGTRIVEGGAYAFIHFDEPHDDHLLAMRDTINANWDCGRALLPGDAPAGWTTGASPRFPDLMVMADPGCAVVSTIAKLYKVTPGDHGWPPEMPEMKGIFRAMGPRIPAGTRVGVIHVSDIYPLMLEILGLQAPHPIDGDPERLPSLLLPVDGSPAG
jgi:predicted AlkP superfamily phosphohydrolase/phosphomutase